MRARPLLDVSRNVLLLAALVLLAVGSTAVHAQTAPGSWEKVEGLPDDLGRYDDLTFVDAQHGWVVSSAGVLFGTTDGAETWSLLFNSADEPEGGVYFRSVAFADTQRGWLGTLNSPDRVLWETTDGGQTVTNITDRISGADVEGLCGMWVVDDQTIYAVGTYYSAPVIVKTTDGGQTWNARDMSDLVGGIIDIHFFDANRGIATGRIYEGDASRAAVIGTEDGGETWTVRGESSGNDEWGWKISFPTEQTGYVAVQSFGTAKVLKTTDGGQTWTELPLGVPRVDGLSAIGFTSENVGWTAGWPTTNIQLTEDGGQTWTPVPLGDQSVVNRIRIYEFDGEVVGFGGGRAFYRYVPSATTSLTDGTPEGEVVLGGNFPNPFNTSTFIPFWLDEPASVRLVVYDLLGRRVASLVDGPRSPGLHRVEWDGANESGQAVAAGVYVYQLEVGAERMSGKAVVQR